MSFLSHVLCLPQPHALTTRSDTSPRRTLTVFVRVFVQPPPRPSAASVAVLSTLQGSGVGLGTVGKAIDLSRVRVVFARSRGRNGRESPSGGGPETGSFLPDVGEKKQIPHPQHSSTPWLNYLELLVQNGVDDRLVR